MLDARRADKASSDFKNPVGVIQSGVVFAGFLGRWRQRFHILAVDKDRLQSGDGFGEINRSTAGSRVCFSSAAMRWGKASALRQRWRTDAASSGAGPHRPAGGA